MRSFLQRTLAILSPRDKRKLAWLLLSFVVMSLFEVVGIASIMPFMQLAARPEVIQENAWMASIYDAFGFASERSFLLAAGAGVLLLLTASNAAGFAVYWLQHRVVWRSIAGLHTRLLTSYLAQPYEYFLEKNSNDLKKQLLSEVSLFAQRVMLPLLKTVASTLVALVILALLIAVDPGLALTVLVVLGGSYGLFYMAFRKYMMQTGKTRFAANRQLFRAAGEVFNDIKIVKSLGAEDFFLRRLAKASNKLAEIQPRYSTLLVSPSYIVRTMAFGGILVIILYLLAQRENLVAVIPVLSLYALAGYRLLPALQNIFSSVGDVRFHVAVVDSIFEDLSLAGRDWTDPSHSTHLAFAEAIRLQDVSFRYEGSESPVLDRINMEIARGERVGFVGPTGSGKSTLVDIIIGLLEIESGAVTVDGVEIGPHNVRPWMSQIGYVPQDVTLLDDTVARNIAFGLGEQLIDFERIKEVARVAGIDDFISRELPDGYETHVGERGVRLSGGQKQRIGLARALYRHPRVLVLDEATSALDSITEAEVMKRIAQLDESVTQIIIAHRLSTVENCDCIYLIDAGRIEASGRYEDLIRHNMTFQGMAKAVLQN